MLRDLWLRLTANPAYKLLSLLLALSAWLYVQSDTVVEGKLRVPVLWLVPADLGSVEPLPGTVTLQIQGTRIAMRNAQEAAPQLVMELDQLGQGSHTLELFPEAVTGLPPGIEVVEVSPGSLRVTLDEQVNRRVPVVAEAVGEPAPGFHVDGIVIDPSVVEVRGPRTVIRTVDSLPTVPVDVSGLAADAIVDVELQPPRAVSLASDVRARASVRVVPELEQRVFASVPVTVWRQPDWRATVDTVEVTLEGPSGRIREMTTEEVAAFVHLPDRPTRGSYEATFGPERGLRVRVLQPGGDEVRVVSMEPMQVPVVRR